MPGTVHLCVSGVKSCQPAEHKALFFTQRNWSLYMNHHYEMNYALAEFTAEGCCCNISVLKKMEADRLQCLCTNTCKCFCAVYTVSSSAELQESPRGMNPLKLFLPGSTGSGNYCLFSLCDLYGATCSWPISHHGRQACEGCSASW